MGLCRLFVLRNRQCPLAACAPKQASFVLTQSLAPKIAYRVAAYRSGAFSHFLKAKQAVRRVASGRWQWRGDERKEIEEVELHAHPCRTVYVDPPPSVKFEWKPRPSGAQRIRVWQAKAGM